MSRQATFDDYDWLCLEAFRDGRWHRISEFDYPVSHDRVRRLVNKGLLDSEKRGHRRYEYRITKDGLWRLEQD